jgi:hypothetical protein
MHQCDVAPSNGVHSLHLEAPKTSLHSISRLFPGLNELHVMSSTSICAGHSLLSRAPLLNIHRLTVKHVAHGVEVLLDDVMFPRLRRLHATIIPLFVAFMRRRNHMRTFDGIDYLGITDAGEPSISLKHWHVVLNTLPRLRTLIIVLNSKICPPREMADLLVNYVRRVAQQPLVYLSFAMHERGDKDSKQQLMEYFLREIEKIHPVVYAFMMNKTRADLWM